ncbi:response regulator transcription factor [Catenovulum sp. SX2]|uniref:response regulator transcription factor n=1 Tax=Catenovulum sp. SX2 TaxID=3398614 RepID=UPI003F87F0C3
MTIRVLLVEDDVRLADSVMQYFELQGITVDPCTNGKQATNFLQQSNYDVIACDVNMPKMDGLEFCHNVRASGADIPFIFISANDGLDDKLLGFDKGADDYLTKPFELRELLARVKSLSNRKSNVVETLDIKECQLQLNLKQRKAYRQQQPVKLTKSAWNILEVLAKSYPEPVSKQDLAFAIWGEEVEDIESLKVHIYNLRKVLDKPFDFAILHSVSGFGFKLAGQS